MKKILAIALAVMMLIGCAAFVSAAETTLPDSDGNAWWVNHTEGIELTEEGFTVTFTSTTYADAANNWNGPLYVLYTSEDATITADPYFAPGYVEYWVQRVDNYGWVGAVHRWSGDEALAGAGITYAVDETNADWGNFLANMKAGIECSVTAKLEDGKAVVVMDANGVVSTVTAVVDTTKPVYLSLFAELATLTNIVVTTPDAEVEAPIANGDQVKIYYPNNETYISATANDNGKKLLEANEEEAAVFDIVVDDNGYISFICDGKYLTSGATGNSLTLEDAASDYSLWTLEAAENGWFIKNVNAAYYENAQYLEFYSGFTTYGKKDTSDVALYTYQFVVLEQEAPIEPSDTIQGCLKYADADWWPSTAGDCFFEYTGPGTYTIKLENITATFGCGLDVASMFYIEFAGGYETMKDLEVSEMTIIVDGEPIAVNLDYVWTYESLGTDYLPTGAYCIEIYNIYGYSGSGAGAAIDPNIFADESIEITFTLTDPNAAPEPNPDTGDAIFAILSLLAVSGMGLTAVAFTKKK